jgi:6-phosphogluconolactonase
VGLVSKTIVYIGSYSPASHEGIYTFELDQTTGELTQAFAPVTAENPSYLAFNSDKTLLYAVLETFEYNGEDGGGAAAFTVDPSGRLELINTRPTGGRAPCFVSVDSGSRFLFAANYYGGNFTAFPLGQGGSIGSPSAIINHEGHGPVRERQDAAHPHLSAFTPDEKYIFTVDLGIDQVQLYTLDMAQGSLHEETELAVRLKPGSGPRHMEFIPDRRFAYIISELNSEVTVLKYDSDYKFEIIQYVSTVPPDYKEPNAPAALHISGDGRFLYASNRGHDSIAVYRIGENGMLDLCGIYPSLGNWPRDFAIAPGGDFLLCANERSNTVTVFKLDRATGAPVPTGFSAGVHSPACIKFKTID